jgi:peptide chain release factor subunit 1
MTLADRAVQLAKVRSAAPDVVSLYLNTRWADEHQRDRARVFVRDEIRRARRARPSDTLDGALTWVADEAEAHIAQARDPDAQGLALFAGSSVGLREVLPIAVPFVDAFAVAEAPQLRPLAEVLALNPPALAVFVDGERARLIPVAPADIEEESVLETEVPGRHRRGGWAQLAQSKYERHIEFHRGQHLEAVVHAVAELVERGDRRWVVPAGEAGAVAAFQGRLPAALAARVAGSVAAAWHDTAAAIRSRAAEVVRRREEEAAGKAVEAALTEAAKGGRAVAGLDETLEAVTRGAVHRLLLLASFAEAGGACQACGRLQTGPAETCRRCGGPAGRCALGEAAVGRVLAAGGTATVLGTHAGLARVGGLAAILRFPL